MRVFAWGNILLQLVFPLSLSFTPAIAATPTSTISTTNVATEPYILGVGENVNSVAKKHGISVDKLKQINIYRTFSKPFIALTAGDEIEVPRKISPFSIDNEKNKNADYALGNKLVGHVQTGAAALATGHVAKSAESMVRSAANNEFNSTAQQWLSQLGTARVQMNLNDDFKLDGSAVDVLVPLFDDQKSILFTQLGARNNDSRNTVNIGAGVRATKNNWMYGANTFFDNDITGKNRRVGVGAEAWTDYLKLSANSYFGTTDWHQSRDFADYNERPASGYDVRAEAYLPTYPQLGGKLMYEKYRGEEVALFGKDNLQKNPHAVTAGVNYTPIPLLTMGAEHRAGRDSKNNSSINFQLNYRLGESWQSHINPPAVASARTLAGSRYDLVERNNNIVMDYQKQNLISLSLPEVASGDAGHSTRINALVTSKYGLERIDWDAAALIAAGGRITVDSASEITIVLPSYQFSNSNLANSYTLSGIAYDIKGNQSNQAITLVTVNAQNISVANSQTFATPDILVADGVSTSQITVILRDDNRQPISGVTRELALAAVFSENNARQSAQTHIQLGSITETTSGVYTATLVGGIVPGVATITPSLNGQILTPVNISLTTNATTSVVSDLTADALIAVADNSALITFTATLKDSSGDVIPNAEVAFASSGGTLSAPISVTNAAGQATVTLKNTVAEQVTVTAKSVANGGDAGKTQNVAFTANMATNVIASLVAAPASVEADNGSLITLTAVLNDVLGNLVPNGGVTFSTTGGTLSGTTVVTDSKGEASITLKSSVVGIETVTAKSTVNTLDSGKNHDVTFTTPIVTSLVLTQDKGRSIVEGGVIQMSVAAKNAAGVSIPNMDVTFSVLSVLDRQGMVMSGRPLQLDATNIGSRVFNTGSTGDVVIPVTDPEGIGVKTTISASTGAISTSMDVIFSVITSPDTATANMYGHMDEVAYSGSRSFTRPILRTEYSGSGSIAGTVNKNEVWLQLYNTEGNSLCQNMGRRQAVIEELSDFYNSVLPLKLNTMYGWPVTGGKGYYNSSTPGATDRSTLGLSFSTGLTSNISGFADRTFIICTEN